MLVRMTHDGRLQCSVQPYHKAVSCRVVGVVLLRWIPHIFVRLSKGCDSNWRPWSVVIVCGNPKGAIQPGSTARDTVSAVMSWMRKASGERLKGLHSWGCI